MTVFGIFDRRYKVDVYSLPNYGPLFRVRVYSLIGYSSLSYTFESFIKKDVRIISVHEDHVQK